MIQFVSEQDFVLQNFDKASPRFKKGAQKVLFIKADWCGHCRTYLPEFEKFSIKYPNVQFLVLETEDNKRLVSRWKNIAHPVFHIEGFPTVVLYDNEGAPIKIIENRFALNDEL